MLPNRWARLSRWGSTWLPLPRPWGTETGRRRPTTSSTTRWTPRYSTRVVFNPSDPPLQVWDLFYDADSVRSMLTRKIQEESLRTYLFTYSNVYDSISIVSTEICFRILFIFTSRNCQQLTSKCGSNGVKFLATSLTTVIARQLLTHTY